MKFSITKLLFVLATFSLTGTSWAGGLYLETGLGAGKINDAENYFGTDAPESTTTNLATNLTLGKNISRGMAFLQLHLGLQHRFVTSKGSNDKALNTMAIYPLIRFEFPRLFVGVGYAPYVWARMDDTDSFANYGTADGLSSILGEVGLLWRIIPSFHVSVVAATTLMTGGTSQALNFDGTVNFRFFLTDSGTDKTKRPPFDGWRYPFGLEIF